MTSDSDPDRLSLLQHVARISSEPFVVGVLTVGPLVYPSLIRC